MVKGGIILVVDDDPLNVKLLINILEAENEVLFALNGQKAVELAEEEQPDIILLDIGMPEQSGYEICTILKQKASTQDIPVIFISSLVDHEDEDKGLQCGAIDYITKPINAAIVRSRINNHLELKQTRDLLQQQACMDSLTGIANRRSFENFALKSWRNMQREEKYLSVIMIDIDYFKPFNDFYGHQGGDDCLRKVAGIMQDIVARPSDLLARYGGEEFVCILPSTDREGADFLAESLRAAVENAALPHEQSTVSGVVTISVGVASTIPNDTQELEDFINAADEALYRAKKSGRNQVCLD